MKRLLAALLAGVTAVGLSACASAPDSAPAAEPVETAVMQDTAVYGDAKNPKYVFLFIGDGMSYPQFQAAADYLGAMADPDYMQAEPSISQADRKGAVLNGPKALNFMNFDVAGSAVTYDSCSFAPDSASTATSIATGHKTYSSMMPAVSSKMHVSVKPVRSEDTTWSLVQVMMPFMLFLAAFCMATHTS